MLSTKNRNHNIRVIAIAAMPAGLISVLADLAAIFFGMDEHVRAMISSLSILPCAYLINRVSANSPDFPAESTQLARDIETRIPRIEPSGVPTTILQYRGEDPSQIILESVQDRIIARFPSQLHDLIGSQAFSWLIANHIYTVRRLKFLMAPTIVVMVTSFSWTQSFGSKVLLQKFGQVGIFVGVCIVLGLLVEQAIRTKIDRVFVPNHASRIEAETALRGLYQLQMENPKLVTMFGSPRTTLARMKRLGIVVGAKPCSNP